MQTVFSKIILWLISLTISLFIFQQALADKYSIDRFDRYLDNEAHFYDDQGNKVFLDQYEGTTILLVFWATWCGSCVSELPALDNLQKDFRKLPFKIISVSQDFAGIEVVKNHFAAHEIRHLEAFHDRKNKLFRELSIIGLPTAFLINAEGKNKIVFRGRIKWHDDKIRSMILSEIGEDLELPKNTYKFESLNRNVMLKDVSSVVESVNPREAEEQKSEVK
jgi:thiol-disulfide isomerase/thioredoxin